jgi:uncharacterized protein YhbP (UPF0306 family)
MHLRNSQQSRFQNLFFLAFQFNVSTKKILSLQGIQQDEEIRKTQKESKARYLLCSLHY